MAIRKASGSPDDKLRQRKLETDILFALGNLDYSVGVNAQASKLLDNGIQAYQQAVIVAKQIGDRTRQAKALLGLGEIYDIKSNYPKAIESFQEALLDRWLYRT